MIRWKRINKFVVWQGRSLIYDTAPVLAGKDCNITKDSATVGAPSRTSDKESLNLDPEKAYGFIITFSFLA